MRSCDVMQCDAMWIDVMWWFGRWSSWPSVLPTWFQVWSPLQIRCSKLDCSHMWTPTDTDWGLTTSQFQSTDPSTHPPSWHHLTIIWPSFDHILIGTTREGGTCQGCGSLWLLRNDHFFHVKCLQSQNVLKSWPSNILSCSIQHCRWGIWVSWYSERPQRVCH